MDLAVNMLAEYRATANELGLSSSQMTTVQGNLLTADPVDFSSTNPPMTEEQLSDFDLVAICMALHHVDDLDLAVKRLVERLRPGGVLLIIDWATKTDAGKGITGAAHPASHTVSHNSFTREQILGLFAGAGCGEADFVLAERLSDVPKAWSGKMQMFWARATKL